MNSSDSLKKWLLDFIDAYRQEYSLLTEEKKKFARYLNCLPPCQFEVVWLQNPEFQLIIKTNFDNGLDKEIIVRGPLNSSEFVDTMDEVIKQEKYQRLVNEDEDFRTLVAPTYSKRIALHARSLLFSVKESIFDPHHCTGNMGSMALYGLSITEWAGNIADIDVKSFAQELFQDIKQQATYHKEHLEEFSKPRPPFR